MVLVFVNLSANNGKSERKWESLKPFLERTIHRELYFVPYHPPFDMVSCIKEITQKKKIRMFISVGGDGSLNYLLSSLLSIDEINIEECCIGGIGLGSSNDFYKPYHFTPNKVPIRINFIEKRKHDIGVVKYTNKDGVIETRYFINNASIGVVASANHLFNEGDYIINLFKHKFVLLVIFYTAIKTIMQLKKVCARLKFNNTDTWLNINNLNIFKNPHISGNFKYEQDVPPDNRQFGLSFFHDTGKFGTIIAMKDMLTNNFNNPKRRNRTSSYTQALNIKTDSFIHLETDGEVAYAKNIEFYLLPQQVWVSGLGYAKNDF
jgi:diacylglycerol kinase family enzyme